MAKTPDILSAPRRLRRALRCVHLGIRARYKPERLVLVCTNRDLVSGDSAPTQPAVCRICASFECKGKKKGSRS